MRLRNAQDISDWRLCVGCGACASICTEGNISLVDMPWDGIRPVINANTCNGCNECLKVCPGLETTHYAKNGSSGPKGNWGTILELWEGYATDPEVRFHGSSGGVASALALYCLEKEGMAGVLHVGSDIAQPYKNRTVFSRNRSDILRRTGSRYSPASPCDGLKLIGSALKPCAFIGKPCDVAAVRKVQMMRPEMDKNVGITIGIFCAGTPSTQGTLGLLKKTGIDPDSIEEVRYRGRGWPGKFAVRLKGDNSFRELSTYMDAWGFVQKYRPYRCYLCPDGTSEFADISCGDPWYREIKEREQGYSLVLARTERGRQILGSAVRDRYLTLKRVKPEILSVSQRNLLSKRGAIWGRILAMKAFGIPTPRLAGFSLFENWLSLPIKEKNRSVLGTVRRIIQRKYYRPSNL